jgi:competence protein ComEC
MEHGQFGLRHAAMRALIAVAAGIAFGRAAALPLWVAAAAALVGALLAWPTRGFTLYVALAAAGFTYARARLPLPVDRRTYEQGRFTAVVVDEPTRPGVSRYTVSLQPPFRGRVGLWIPDGHLSLRYGDLIEASARIQPPDYPRNPGLPDFSGIMLQRGMVGSARGRLGQIRVVSRGHGLVWMRAAVIPLRRYVARVIDRYLPEAEGALFAGLLLGGRQGLPRDVQQAFTDAGIVHILAVSGMNVTIIVGLVWLLLSLLGIRGWWQFGLGVAAEILYLTLVGWSAAPARAGVMAAAVMFALPVQRRVSATASLAVAGLALLLIDPSMLFDAGAQLSFAATLGIVLVAESLKEPFSTVKNPRQLRSKLLTPLVASVGATAATAPLMLHHFFRVQPLAFLTTSAVVPLVGLAMPLGIVVLVAHAISGTVAGIFANALWAVLWLLLKLTLLMGRLQWAIWEPGRLSWLWVGWAYAAMLLGLNWQRRWARAGLALALAAGLNAAIWPAAFRKPQTRIVFLDPGRGDAVLLEDTLGHRILVDAGIDGTNVVRDYLRSRGIHRLDAAIITHPDRDHFGGLLDLDARCRIKQLLVPVSSSSDTGYERLLRRLSARGTAIRLAGRGTELTGCGFGVSFVWPDPTTRAMFNRGMMPTNAVSLVARVRHSGFVMLLTGDMDDPGLLPADDLRADLVKSPHHGSRKGNPPMLYDLAQPRYVVVMGRYPTPAHLESRFAGSGVDYVNTRRDGALTIVFESGLPRFRRYR